MAKLGTKKATVKDLLAKYDAMNSSLVSIQRRLGEVEDFNLAGLVRRLSVVEAEVSLNKIAETELFARLNKVKTKLKEAADA